jgi:hypothetical protein
MAPHSTPKFLPCSRSILIIFASGLIFTLLVGLLAFGIHQMMRDNPVGIDYYIFWSAGRAVIEGQNPYSAEVTRSIQEAVYQRPARENEDPMPFNYPLYVLIAVIPTLFFKFAWAQPIWMAFNILSLLLLVVLGLRFAPQWIGLSLPFLYNFAFGIILGNFSVLIAGILIFSYGLIIFLKQDHRSLQILTGALLAWCTAKPQFVWAYLGFILLFALRRKLYPLLLSFVATTAILLALSFVIFPGWLGNWVDHLRTYTLYTNNNRSISVITQALFPPGWSIPAGYILIGASFCLLIIQIRAWLVDRIPATSVLISLSLASYLLIPNNTSAEQLILWIAIILWVADGTSNRVAKMFFWAMIFGGSYLVFGLSYSGIFPPAVHLYSLAVFLLWILLQWALKTKLQLPESKQSAL